MKEPGRAVGKEALHGLLAHPEARRFGKFLLVGLLNTAVGYTIFAVLLLVGAGTAGAAVGATVLGALFNFKSIGTLVFGSSRGRLLPKFLAVYALQCIANISLLEAFRAVGIPPLISEAFILPVLAIGSFLIMKHWVFNNRQSSDGPGR